MAQGSIQQMMDEINVSNNLINNTGVESDNVAKSLLLNQTLTNEQEGTFVDSLCTRDANIRDAMENMKALQDATINSSFKEHKSQEQTMKNLVDEVTLKKLNDLDLKEILDKRANELK